jgi:hypothetical protein
MTLISGNRSDWIPEVKAFYNLEGTDAQWLSRVLDLMSPLLARGTDLLGWTFRCKPTTFTLSSFSEGTPQALIYVASLSHARAGITEYLERGGPVDQSNTYSRVLKLIPKTGGCFPEREEASSR